MINFKKILAVIVFGLCANVDADVYEVNLESGEIGSIKTPDDDKSILTRLDGIYNKIFKRETVATAMINIKGLASSQSINNLFKSSGNGVQQGITWQMLGIGLIIMDNEDPRLFICKKRKPGGKNGQYYCESPEVQLSQEKAACFDWFHTEKQLALAMINNEKFKVEDGKLVPKTDESLTSTVPEGKNIKLFFVLPGFSCCSEETTGDNCGCPCYKLLNNLAESSNVKIYYLATNQGPNWYSDLTKRAYFKTPVLVGNYKIYIKEGKEGEVSALETAVKNKQNVKVDEE